MQEITIIGAGMAGLTAALRLAERGYKVTIFERDSFIGGKFRATKWEGRENPKRFAFHEHSYHMFLNWYHNFWQIADEIGAVDDFIPLTKVKFMRRGEFPRMKELENFGALSAVPQNLCSGILSVPDMFLYMYSVVDLLSTHMKTDRYRDLISVNAFATTKAYATEASASLYDEYLAKTFSIASYESSAKTFQTFLEYGSYCPDPMYWSLEGDCFNFFLKKIEERLKQLGVRIRYNHYAMNIAFENGNASAVDFDLPDYDASLSEMPIKDYLKGRKEKGNDSKPDYSHPLTGPLIIAVPHGCLAWLLSPAFLNLHPELGETAKLRSVPMASVHLHLKKPFSERLEQMGAALPREPVVLIDSKYKLSFVANSCLWPDPTDTYLNVVASDSRPLNRFPSPGLFNSDWKQRRGRPRNDSSDEATETVEDRSLALDSFDMPSPADLSLDQPRSTLDHILKEFRDFVPFADGDIDLDLLQIDRNVGRELFINDVGSGKSRPETHTKVRNIFLAGDYCKNVIDVVCLEGAVVSGLQAAEAIRRQCGHRGTPIQITRPRRHPRLAYWPLKLAMTPYAYAAKACAVFGDLLKGRVD